MSRTENKIFLNGIEGAEKKYISCLIYAGIAKYNDKNWKHVLINKHIDDIAKSFVGSPIVEGHNQPTSENDPIILGRIERVFCNGEGFFLKDGTEIKADGKYYCEFVVFNENGEQAVERNGYLSTSYTADKVIEPQNGEKFEYINVPYDVEIESVKARHVALVSKPRYEDAVIYENEKEQIMEHESKIEIEKGVFVSFLSSAADKGRELISGIFDNAKKKKDNMSDEEAKKDLEKLEKHEEEEIKEEKDNSKKKKDNSEEKEEKKEESKDNSDEEDMENGFEDVDGEKVSKKDLIECWKNSKKENEKTKDNSKDVSLDEIESKSFDNSSGSKKVFKIGAAEIGLHNFFNK